MLFWHDVGLQSAKVSAQQNTMKFRKSTVRRPALIRPWCVRVLDSTGLHRISFARVSEESFRTFVFDSLDVLVTKKDGCLLGEPSRRRPVLPGPALPRRLAVQRRTPTRPWCVRVLDSTSVTSIDERLTNAASGGRPALFVASCRPINQHLLLLTYLSTLKPGHTTSESGRGGAARGGAGRGMAGRGRRQVCSPRKQPTRLPSRTIVLNASSEARITNFYVNRWDTKPAVDMRFIRSLSAGRRPLFVPGC